MERLILRAVRPWDSMDAISDNEAPDLYGKTPQAEIDRCLFHCPFADGECRPNQCRRCEAESELILRGRSRKYDPDELREILKLRPITAGLCQEMGISRTTLWRARKRLQPL